MLAAFAYAEDGKAQDKRGAQGAPSYATQAPLTAAYAKVAAALGAQKGISYTPQQYIQAQPSAAVKYAAPASYSAVPAPQQQQYYQPQAQAVAYAQPAVARVAAAPAIQKVMPKTYSCMLTNFK